MGVKKAELKSLLNDKEYKTAHASIVNAYYTQPTIVTSIQKMLANVKSQEHLLSVLEPSCGIGNFFVNLSQDVASQKTGIELDSVSGRIAPFQLFYNSCNLLDTNRKE